MARAEATARYMTWRAAGVPAVITGAEAANLAREALGYVPAGLIRNQDSHSEPVSLAYVALAVERAAKA